MRDQAKYFPDIAAPALIRTMRVWACKYKTHEPLAQCFNLEVLMILAYPDAELSPIGALTRLRHLKIVHLPKITSLASLSNCTSLESLSLSPAPSWDASGRVTTIESLDPIASLSNLRHLELFGVRPADKSVAPLERLPSLRTARFAKYPRREPERFYNATNVEEAFNPDIQLGQRSPTGTPDSNSL